MMAEDVKREEIEGTVESGKVGKREGHMTGWLQLAQKLTKSAFGGISPASLYISTATYDPSSHTSLLVSRILLSLPLFLSLDWERNNFSFFFIYQLSRETELGENDEKCGNSRHGHLLPSYLCSAGDWSRLWFLFLIVDFLASGFVLCLVSEKMEEKWEKGRESCSVLTSVC